MHVCMYVCMYAFKCKYICVCIYRAEAGGSPEANCNLIFMDMENVDFIQCFTVFFAFP